MTPKEPLWRFRCQWCGEEFFAKGTVMQDAIRFAIDKAEAAHDLHTKGKIYDGGYERKKESARTLKVDK